MGRIVKFFSTVRTHWKKSIFVSALAAYGVNYGLDHNEIQCIMRRYCNEAAKLGDAAVGNNKGMKHITVILNPAANRRKAKKNFEKYCAPILNLSGAFVTILETTGEGEARKLIEKIDPRTNAIVVAGGDGTLSETVTGLMRNKGELCNIPVGVLPLGKYNTLANRLFNENVDKDVERIATAAMAVVQGKTQKINTYRVEALDGEEKAVYGVAWLELGCWNYVKKRARELWLMGSARNYIPLLFPRFDSLTGSVAANIRFTKPCDGCSHCYAMRPDLSHPVKVDNTPKRWWSSFAKNPAPAAVNRVDYSTVTNEECAFVFEDKVLATDLRLSTDFIFKDQDVEKVPPHIVLSIGPKSRYQGKVLLDGIEYFKGNNTFHKEVIEAKQLEIRPEQKFAKSEKKENEEETNDVILIDNEEYEIRPIRITVLPNSLSVFVK